MIDAIKVGLALGFFDVPWYILAFLPFQDKLKVTKRTLIFIVLSVCVVRFMINFFLVLLTPNPSHYSWLEYVIYFLLIAATYIFTLEFSAPKLIYVFLMVQSISATLNFTVYAICAMLYPNQAIGLISSNTYVIFRFLSCWLCFPFLWKIFNKGIRHTMEQLQNKTIWQLCIAPVLFVIIGQIFVGYAGLLKLKGPVFFSLYVLINFVGLVTYYVNIRLVISVSEQSRLEADTQYIKKQLVLQNQHFTQLTESIENARRARHDLRHHLSVILGFAEKGETEVLLQYLVDYRKSIPLDMEPPFCTNHVVDILARHYFSQAREAGADTDIRLTLPKEIGITDADLCIIFGNIFENAVNAVKHQTKGDKFIRARCDCENHSVVLTVDNSTETEEGKSNGSGIGLTSVTAVAKRYEGNTVFRQENGIYQSCVILSLL